MTTQSNLVASKNPLEDIALITPEGQEPHMRKYVPGYEHYFNSLPRLSDNDDLLGVKLEVTRNIMDRMSADISAKRYLYLSSPEPGSFKRNILALESPYYDDAKARLVEGAEIVLAQWGKGFSSPVHGHAAGYLHEQLLYGSLLVNTYQLTDVKHRIVRPLRTDIIKNPGLFASLYTDKGNDKKNGVRSALIHNFRAIEESATLHYLTEHTRDGRDNGYIVQRFENMVPMRKEDFTQISSYEGLYLQPGDVALVRSSNVPEYGDHYIVITGHPIVKDHGLRPQEVSIEATQYASEVLDQFEPSMGLTLLKLNEPIKKLFLDFHNIEVVDKKVHFKAQ